MQRKCEGIVVSGQACLWRSADAFRHEKTYCNLGLTI